MELHQIQCQDEPNSIECYRMNWSEFKIILN